MKKYLFIMSAAALALASCSEEQELVNTPVNQANRVLTATFEQDAATRTSIDGTNNNALTWSGDDEIAVYGTIGENQGQALYLLASGVGTASATFALDEAYTAPTDIVGAAFPYANANNITEGKLEMNLTSAINQTGESANKLDLPMWGTVTDGKIAFKHLAGVLKVNLTGLPAGYNKLVVTASNPIRGYFTFDTKDTEPVLTSTSTADENKTVTVSFTNATATTLYLPLPVGTYESIVVSVSNGTDSKVLKQFSGITVERAKVYSTSADINTYVTTADELRTAIAQEGVVNLGADITITEPLVISAAVTLNGNNFTIENTTKGTSARAINVNVAGDVKIKDLTVVAAGQRAINVIQKKVNLTLENVTATAANYAVNVAASSVGSTITINNSDITGLNAVNIAGQNTQVSITNTNITCDDQNDSEGYGAISIEKNGSGAVVTFSSGSVTVSGDSFAGQVSADGASITIAEDVTGENKTIEVGTCVIEYGESPYYYSFSTIEAALEKVKDGETIKLIEDVTLTSTLTVSDDKNVILDLNGKTITISKEDEATAVTDFINRGTMTIKNGSISAGDAEFTRRCIYNYGTMTIDGVNFTQQYGQKGAAINNEGTMTIQGNTTVNSVYYSIWNSGSSAQLTVENGTFTCDNIDDVEHPCYCVNNLSGATLIVNDGAFTGDHGAIGLQDSGTTATLNKGTFTCTGVVGQSDHVISVLEGTTLKYNESSCTFDNSAEGASDAGGKLIYNGGGTIDEISGV